LNLPNSTANIRIIFLKTRFTEKFFEKIFTDAKINRFEWYSLFLGNEKNERVYQSIGGGIKNGYIKKSYCIQTSTVFK